MVGIAISFVVALAVTWLLVRVGPRLGYVDRPDDSVLKAHTRPAVPLGGVAIFVGVAAGLLWAGQLDVRLLAAAGLLLVLGLVDDRVGLSPLLRLVVTSGAGVVVALESPNVLAGAVMVVLVVVAVNAVNLFDGLDGLAASSAAVAALALAGLAALRGADATVPLILAAALVGFLVLNWHPARAFLGDNGAYVVAVLLAWSVAEGAAGLSELMAGFGLLGVFLVDLVVTVWRRRRAGDPLFAGDRSHLYDRLHQAGWSVPSVAIMVAAAQTVLGGLILFFVWSMDPVWALAAVAGLGASVVIALTFVKSMPAPSTRV